MLQPEMTKQQLYQEYLKGMWSAGIGDVNYRDNIVKNALYEAELQKSINKDLQAINDNQKELIIKQRNEIEKLKEKHYYEITDISVDCDKYKSHNIKLMEDNKKLSIEINNLKNTDLELVNNYLLKVISEQQTFKPSYYFTGDKTCTVSNTWGGPITGTK